MTKCEIVQKLAMRLERLVAILRLDPQCPWTAKFERDLLRCRRLIEDGYSQSELSDLSSSITHVFAGMGSFNDYCPTAYDPATGRFNMVAGMTDFDAVAGEVYDLAVELRVVGRY